MVDQFNPIIKAYRKNETLPTSFDRSELVGMLSAINVGLAKGMPKVGADTFGDKVLVEGRADAGTDAYNYNNKNAASLVQSVMESSPDMSERGAMYVGAVLDKSDVANRLNIPFERAWNGTGKSALTGRTGQQHADRSVQMQGAIDDPRNKEFKDLITRGISGELTGQENASQIKVDTLRSIFAGLDKGVELVDPENRYTAQAISGMQANVDARLKEAKLPAQRERVVRTDLKDTAELLNFLPDMWRTAAGVGDTGRSLGGSSLDLTRMSPDTIGILNTITGK